MSSTSSGVQGLVGASVHARELSKRRVSAANIQSPSTPITPVAPTTPMLAAHIFAEGNMMEDLQLAAELGKTLLERNKELEGAIKEQRVIIDDKTQEIEYLSKQTAALREVNDSRLRIYEQLEISIQELEKSNQRLSAETGADKKKIKGLSGTVEQLEAKCEDLQKYLDEARSLQLQQHQKKQHSNNLQQQQGDRGRTVTRRSLVSEENSVRRSMSCENTAQAFEDMASEFYEMNMRMGALQAKLDASLKECEAEVARREEVEIELSCVAQENNVLREQIEVLKEKGSNAKSFEDEITSLDDTTSSKFCRKCMGLADETGSNMTVQDFTDDIEDMDASYDNIQGECALVRLKNGGYAWGSQESLASMGQVVNCVGSSGSSPQTEASEAPHNSLLSELDTQYRILIEKYEALVEAREYHKEQEETKEGVPSECTPHTSYFDSGVDEVSGPMSLVMTERPPQEQSVNSSLHCQRCTTCSCDLKPTRPKSNLEELSEVETSSSGFSEGESRFGTKHTQTEEFSEVPSYLRDAFEETLTPTAHGNGRYLDLHTPMNPCEMRFQARPEYRKLFHEIFEVLKKEVDKKNQVNIAVTRTLMQSEAAERERKSLESRTETEEETSTDVSSFRDENEENKNPNVRQAKRTKEKKTEKKSVKKSNASSELKTDAVEEESKDDVIKPVRPDFLDLETSSRCSSRSRRRRKLQRNRNHPSNESDTTTGQKESKSDLEQLAQNNRCSDPDAKPVQTTSTNANLESSTSTAPSSTEKVYQKPKIEELKNVTKTKCEHKIRKSQHKQRSQQPLQNKHLRNVVGSHPPESQQKTSKHTKEFWAKNHSAVASDTMPSVQVAKLIKFEKSYAEVLKTSKPKRSS